METSHLHQQVAERVAALILGGTFRVGDRLPSIREMSRQAKVSINTVKTAYTHLEDFQLCPISGSNAVIYLLT